MLDEVLEETWWQFKLETSIQMLALQLRIVPPLGRSRFEPDGPP
ncbi:MULTISPECIES: hypothetical protein [unclassified Streptomyces]